MRGLLQRYLEVARTLEYHVSTPVTASLLSQHSPDDLSLAPSAAASPNHGRRLSRQLSVLDQG
jgi:hypothetical protein